MLIDAHNFSSSENLNTEVCIVGSGPAGISLAREFIGLNIQVILLESGGLEYETRTQFLADGNVIGDAIPPIDICRRQLGGNSNSWCLKINPKQNKIGVRHALFDEIDFEKRDWIPNSGWPFSRDHLNSYYERAQVVCGVGPFTYEPDYWEGENCRRLPLETTNLETGMFQFGPADIFYEKYREELKKSDNVTIISHANAVEIKTNGSGKSASQIRVISLPGKEFSVSSKIFILACGGFENARLLLMSNQQQIAGLGNQHDLVGRYYHDHPKGIGGYFTPADKGLFNKTALYDLHQINHIPVMGFLRLSRKLMEREKLPNFNALLFPRPDRRQTKAITSFKTIGEAILKDKLSLAKQPFDQFPTHLLNIFLGLDYVARAAYVAKTEQQPLMPNMGRGGWSELSDNRHRFTRFETFHLFEQSPDPGNRVTLSSELDALGCQKLEVRFRWSQDDAERSLRALSSFSRELLKAGLGKFEIELDEEGFPKVERPIGSHHLMGTTRMHEDPKQGVVDANCRVYGISNLFISGSSTFPTGGYANPTLTIVAMALRLADLVKHELKTTSL